jgi:hypothetical protein
MTLTNKQIATNNPFRFAIRVISDRIQELKEFQEMTKFSEVDHPVRKGQYLSLGYLESINNFSFFFNTDIFWEYIWNNNDIFSGCFYLGHETLEKRNSFPKESIEIYEIYYADRVFFRLREIYPGVFKSMFSSYLKICEENFKIILDDIDTFLDREFSDLIDSASKDKENLLLIDKDNLFVIFDEDGANVEDIIRCIEEVDMIRLNPDLIIEIIKPLLVNK